MRSKRRRGIIRRPTDVQTAGLSVLQVTQYSRLLMAAPTLGQHARQQKASVRHKLFVAITRGLWWCKRADGEASRVFCWEGGGGGRGGLDEYAFCYCCHVMTSLMRSVESWASHFVVSPIHSPALGIHCGIVLRHIHSDGWMHLLMFHTTEHHSVGFFFYLFFFYGLHINTPGLCDNSLFYIPIWSRGVLLKWLLLFCFSELQEYKFVCFSLLVRLGVLPP